MHRFHISPGSSTNGLVTLSVKESHHALAVLRVGPGEVVELLDGQGGVFQGFVAGSEKGRLKISISSVKAQAKAVRTKVTLATSVIKPERMEWLVEKACELGVAVLAPLITERTVVRLSRERWGKKVDRWRKISAETCKQCGQSVAPEVRDVAEFKKFTADLSGYDLVLIPTLAVPVKSLQESLNAHRSAQTVLILIGPEGDFSPNEVKHAVSNGAQPVDLGPLVMRSETAALYAASITRFFYDI